MGLDVTVYQKIKKSNEKDSDFEAYVIDDKWDWKIKELKNGQFYKGKSVGSLSYSYSTHNRFREILINLINRNDLLDSDGRIKWDKLPKDIPFIDFIDFADNEGCLDWCVSEKIYNDFDKFCKIADKNIGGWALDKYYEWLNIFYLAKEKGVVVFS